MVAIIDITKTVDYVLKRERSLEEEKQTIFVLGVIDSATIAKIDDMATSYRMPSNDLGNEAELVFNINQARIEYVKAGLQDVKRLVDGDGKPVVFEEALIDQLPVDDLYELGDAAKKMNKFSGAEEKN